MSTTSTHEEPAALPASHQACLHDAALALGIDAESARSFARKGLLQAGDIGMLLQPRSDVPGDDWLSIARLARPGEVGEARWHEALLTANGEIMLFGHWSFALDAEGAALLMQRIPSDHCDDAQLLSAHMFGALSVVRALEAGLQEPLQQGLQSAQYAPNAPATGSGREAGSPPPNIPDVTDAATCSAAFTAEAQDLLAGAVASLRGDAAAIQALLDCAGMQVLGRHIDVGADPEGEALILAATLDEAALSSPDDLTAALASNVELVSLAGVATGRLAGHPALLGRYRLRNASGEDLTKWLQSFVTLAEAISRPRVSSSAMQ